MNKLIASVGIIALSGSVLHALETGALNAQQSKKSWSVSASLRGFYDDNFNSQPSATKQSSTGFDVSPSVSFGVAGEQTSLSVGYDLTARYYEKVVNGRSDRSDFTHNFNMTGTHAFDERLRVNAREQFVVGQEPDFLAQGGNITNPQRVSGDNKRNNFNVGANYQATQLLGLGLSYNNSIVDYSDQGDYSFSASLDRMEHRVNLDSRWLLSPETTGIIGVQLGKTDYSRSNEKIDVFQPGVVASSRDSKSFIVNAGVEQEFSQDFSGSLLVGAQRIEFPNNASSKATWSPWIESSLKYQLQAHTLLTGGFSYSRSPSDLVAATSATDFVRDTKVAALYAAVKQDIAEHLQASASARYQSVTFNGGFYNGRKDNFLLLGLGLTYQFNENLEGNIGYNFDDLSSDVPNRNYERNKFYVGVTAKY